MPAHHKINPYSQRLAAEAIAELNGERALEADLF